MATDTDFRARLADKLPVLDLIEAAIEAHRDGRPVTQQDPATGEAYVVEDDPALGTFVVRCGDKVLYRSRRKPEPPPTTV